MEGDDEVLAGSEDRVGSEHVVQLGDSVPAWQEHQDGTGL